MGGLFGSRTRTVRQPFKSEPWGPQQRYLRSGFENAQGALRDANRGLSAIDDYAADLTPGQIVAAEALGQIGMGDFQDVGGVFTQAGLGGADALDAATGNAQEIFDRASVDPTSRIMANGQQYAENPYLQGQIDAAIRDVREGFDRDVGNINAGAVGSGNINSTRAGALEAMALDDAMDRATDVSAAMRGAAYESGLDRAFATDQAQFGNMLNANQNILGAGAAGTGLAAQGLDIMGSGANMALAGSSLFQDQAQREIDGARLQAREPLDLSALYMQAVGGNFGSQGYTTSVQTSPGPLQTIMGVASTLGGLGWAPFCWTARAVYGEDDPRWEEFRDWMIRKAPDWLFELYVDNGPRWAEWIKRNPWSKVFIRPIMDICRRFR